MKIKRFQHLLYISTLFLIIGCDKNLPFKEPTLQIEKDSSEYHINNNTIFSFKGNCDNILFYSGEKGMRYEYANRFKDTSGNAILKFNTAKNTTGASGTLKLLYSTNYNNNLANIKNAIWNDIEDISPIEWATSSSSKASGNINLNSLKAQDKPIWLAFRYQANAGSVQSKFTITNILLTNTPANDTTYTLLNLTQVLPAYRNGTPVYEQSPGWFSANVSNNPIVSQEWKTVLSNTNAITGYAITGSTTEGNASNTEQWLITGPINLGAVLRDVPTAIVKGGSTNYTLTLENFNYIYTYPKRGEYKATFIGSNATSAQSNQLIKQLNIKIK